MNALNRTCMVIVIFALLFALEGCKAAATKPFVIENVPVDIERTATCPPKNLKITEGIKKMDPESGEVERMVISEWKFTCSDPYFKGKYIAVQDFFTRASGSSYWIGFVEGVTNEGGVWKGKCENNMDGNMKIVCTLVGEGNYKGLQLWLELLFGTGATKYRITRVEED